MQYHAFLSYSHHDTDIMRRVRTDLIDAGLEVWTDESLVPGTPSWKNAIEDAIQNTMTLVVLLSPDAKHSDWIEKEIEYASACNVRVVPILVRGVDEISAVPFELINVQRIDLRVNYEIGVNRLIDTIQSEGDLSDFSPALSHTESHSGYSLDELNPISIYDHVRLFIWLFWQPGKLVAYHNRFGEETLRQTTAWLVSDLAWIVFIAPAIGIILGTVRFSGDVQTPYLTVMQAVLGVVFLGGWFATGWFGSRDKPVYAMVLLVGTALTIFALFLAVANISGVILANAGGMTRLPFMLLTGVMLSAGAGIAFRMATTATASIAGLLLGSLLFNAVQGVELGIDGGISAVVMFLTAILVAYVIDSSLKIGERTILHVIALTLIVTSGSLMIILYFLGGWIFLLNIGIA